MPPLWERSTRVDGELRLCLAKTNQSYSRSQSGSNSVQNSASRRFKRAVRWLFCQISHATLRTSRTGVLCHLRRTVEVESTDRMELYQQRVFRMNTIGYDHAREMAKEVEDSHGAKVIQLKRVGATPFLRYTPYQNNRGTKVGMWSCISITGKAMPKETLLFRPQIVFPDEHDDWEINMITTPWVVNQLSKTNESRVEVLDAEETPFAGNMMQWCDER